VNFSTLKMSNNHDQPTLVQGCHGRQGSQGSVATSFGSALIEKQTKQGARAFFDTKNKTFNNSRGLRASGKVSVATETRVG
jgi:hypothetical protein